MITNKNSDISLAMVIMIIILIIAISGLLQINHFVKEIGTYLLDMIIVYFVVSQLHKNIYFFNAFVYKNKLMNSITLAKTF